MCRGDAGNGARGAGRVDGVAVVVPGERREVASGASSPGPGGSTVVGAGRRRPVGHSVANASVGRSFAGADESGLVSDDHELGAVARVQFAEDATDVGLRGERRHVEVFADLGVGLAACDLGEHFPFALA
jgi:hypothetical protein